MSNLLGPFRAVALDDEPLALAVLADFCSRSARNISVETYTGVRTARQRLHEHHTDLLFLDIQMPALDGVSFYGELTDKPPLIFTTAHPDFALIGFELGAFDYLLKPFSMARFEQAIDRVLSRMQIGAGGEELILRSNHSLVRIDSAEIVFVESFGDFLHIHLDSGMTHEVRLPLKDFLLLDTIGLLVRIHRSYVVNKTKVHSVKNGTVNLKHRALPIGRQFGPPF